MARKACPPRAASASSATRLPLCSLVSARAPEPARPASSSAANSILMVSCSGSWFLAQVFGLQSSVELQRLHDYPGVFASVLCDIDNIGYLDAIDFLEALKSFVDSTRGRSAHRWRGVLHLGRQAGLLVDEEAHGIALPVRYIERAVGGQVHRAPRQAI